MKRWQGALLSVIVTGVLFFCFYSHDILGAGDIAYGAGGDGYKNYYTLAYYLKYDSGAHFSGMNYPFGENIIFTDNQPVVAWFLKALIPLYPDLANHIHAFLVYACFASILFSAFFVYKILTEFKVDTINATIFTALIVLMSPQMPRMGGHFALSYMLYIPATLCLLIRFIKTGGQLKYLFAVTGLSCVFIFIHIYYAAISGMFFLLVVACYAIVNRQNIRQHLRVPLLLPAAALLPFVLLKTYLFITDPVTDRPTAPWGYVMSRSTVADIFLHPYTFTGQFITRHFPNANIVYHGEGSGYIGLATILALSGALFIYLKSWRTERKIRADIYPLNLFIVPAICVLLFAMAFPFNIDPIEKYYVKMPGVIKQFRASGRFNWIFYYNAVILASILIYRLFVRLCSKNKVLAYFLLAITYGLWFTEAAMISTHTEEAFKGGSVVLNENEAAKSLLAALQKTGKQVNDFQAILPLPFFLNGSEKIYIDGSTAYDAMKASLFIGLPLVGGQMSRTSQSQAFELANLLSNTLIKKDVLSRYKNNKPLLILVDGNKLNKEESALLSKATFLFADNSDKYYQLDLSAFSDSVAETKKYFADNRSKFIEHSGYSSNDSTDNVVVEHFDNEPKSYAVFGKGAHYSENAMSNFYSGTLPFARDCTNYEISFWVYTDSRRAGYPLMEFTQTDSGGKLITQSTFDPKFSTNTYKDWVRGYIDFTLLKKTDKITLTGSVDYATFDEIMIRPENVNVVTQFKNDSTFVFNNFQLY